MDNIEDIINQVTEKKYYGLTWITNNFAISSYYELLNYLETKHENISIINMAEEIDLSPEVLKYNLDYTYIPLENGKYIKLENINKIIYTAKVKYSKGMKIIFTCYGGINRSPSATCIALMSKDIDKNKYLSYESALSLIMEKRKIVSPLPQLLLSIQNFYYVKPLKKILEDIENKFSDDILDTYKKTTVLSYNSALFLSKKIDIITQRINFLWKKYQLLKDNPWNYSYGILTAINRYFVLGDLYIRNLNQILISNCPHSTEILKVIRNYTLHAEEVMYQMNNLGAEDFSYPM
jgi:protein-tyrosine phosphatase